MSTMALPTAEASATTSASTVSFPPGAAEQLPGNTPDGFGRRLAPADGVQHPVDAGVDRPPAGRLSDL